MQTVQTQRAVWSGSTPNIKEIYSTSETGSVECCWANKHSVITSTVNFLNILTPKKLVVITLKVEQDDVSLE